ncbi:helix-turn-helix domain-containing protein [Solibaculum mannosilyticum]|uniref:HTH cro/C1-type domain-containing protein n=1 Tax=Solibaculum mannosilyticum TaxID=2780922 RepID=A0A7I8D6D7_9FIRM|nr:helix-turn-helix transcriptional regulator [Solibaculum mannosilyticum]MCO7137963.1 helix-turn-helix transcriptional regulator [[Clostridium] leptum]BCI60773.1 hypothetical protein C12CBH8_14120 [Solibaculum mannosilyticum]CZT57522.1 helix-turn-helix protein [Eubacteriaceae bacterium CHKCI005]
MDLKKISQLRKASRMTIEELAFESGIPISTVQKISSGITKNPGIETMAALAEALNCSLDDLVDFPYKNGLLFRHQEHVEKYQSLSESAQDRVDSYIEYLWNDPLNRRDVEPISTGKKKSGFDFNPYTEQSEETVKVAVYSSDGQIVGYDWVTKELYEQLEELGFTVTSEEKPDLKIAQPSQKEIDEAFAGYQKETKDQ